MPKKRKAADYGPTLAELLERVWCYYCERDFPDAKVLLDHQKCKHFQCDCGRRLNTAGGLRVHLHQVHKQTLDKIANALPDRESGDIEIFAMEGVPQDLKDQFRAKITQLWYENGGAEREARAANIGQPPAKKQNAEIESSESMLARKKAFIARRKAEKAAAAAGGQVGSGASTPQQVTTPSHTERASEPPARDATIESSDAQNGHAVHNQHTSYSDVQNGHHVQHQNGYPAPLQYNGMSITQNPPHALQPYGGFPEPVNGSYGAPYSMPPVQGYPVHPPGVRSLGVERLSLANQPAPVIPNAPYPPYNGPSSTGPSVPGLPSRPSFNSPNLDKNAMAKLHGTPQHLQPSQNFSPTYTPAPAAHNTNGNHAAAAISQSVDELIANGQKAAAFAEHSQNSGTAPIATPEAESASVRVQPTKNDASEGKESKESKESKKSKKSKKLETVMAYSDPQHAPEQKRAKLGKHQDGFTSVSSRNTGPSTEAGVAAPAVTGTVDEGAGSS